MNKKSKNLSALVLQLQDKIEELVILNKAILNSILEMKE